MKEQYTQVCFFDWANVIFSGSVVAYTAEHRIDVRKYKNVAGENVFDEVQRARGNAVNCQFQMQWLNKSDLQVGLFFNFQTLFL